MTKNTKRCKAKHRSGIMVKLSVLRSFNSQQATANHSKIFLNLIKNRVAIQKTRRIVRHLALIYRAVNAKVSPSSSKTVLDFLVTPSLRQLSPR